MGGLERLANRAERELIHCINAFMERVSALIHHIKPNALSKKSMAAMRT